MDVNAKSMMPGIDMEATGKKISQLIEESGLTDKELGKIMGLSVQSINKWRHGRNMPDIENLYILSRILGTKVDDFLVPQEAMGTGAEGISASVIRRLWAYYIRMRRLDIVF